MSLFTETAEWSWVMTPTGERLHHLAALDDPELTEFEWQGDGVTTCGVRARFWIAGIFSRMGRERCAHCCDRLGFPRGTGAPNNDDALRPWVEKRIASTKAEP